MQSLSQCGHFCNGLEQQPSNRHHNEEPSFGTVKSSAVSTPAPTSQLFAQTNIHDVPSDKLNELSAKYREEAYYDLHGVSTTAVEETPDFVAEKLQELDQQMFLVEQRRAFEMAMEANPHYVQGLRLRFLRAESYDVPRAAHRFALNFEFRWDMFGPHVLGRDILHSDLPEVDQALLDTGYMQVTRGRDRAGRSICVQIMRRLGQEPPPDSAARLFFFCMQFMGNQEYCQKKGVLCCEYMVGIKVEQLLGTNRRARTPLFLRVMASMPVRLNALHVCFDDPRIQALFKLLTSVIEGKLLCRLQSHFGTDMECMYSMLTFGISPGTLPIRGDGSVDTYDHEQWLHKAKRISEEKRAVEEQKSVAQLIVPDYPEDGKLSPQLIFDDMKLFEDLPDDFETPSKSNPSPDDVLMGRGKHGKSWPGNLKLKKVVEQRWDEYKISSRDGKIRISHAIYDDFIASGSRFLIPSKGSDSKDWMDMPRKEVCVRISHLFRNLRAAEQKMGL